MRPEVYLHSLSASDPPSLILNLLATHEAAVTLLQRLQTALQDPPHPQHRQGSTFLLATFPPSTGTPHGASNDSSKTTQPPYTIALAARTNRTDVDVQLYNSIDLLARESVGGKDEYICAAQSLAVLAKFKELDPLPPTPTGPEISVNGRAYAQDLLILGCVHVNTATALRAHAYALLPKTKPMLGREFVRDDIAGKGGPFNKWIWDVQPRKGRSEDEVGEVLPEGLHWSTVRPGADRAQVMRWNEYVRSPDVLEGLGCAAIRADPGVSDTDGGAQESDKGGGEMVAWAFRSLDGSIRTVHCMESWRRRGLAGMVVRRVLRGDEEDASNTRTQTQTQRLGHTNIYPGNTASEQLFRSCVGARNAYEVFWMRVDFGVLEGLVVDVEEA